MKVLSKDHIHKGLKSCRLRKNMWGPQKDYILHILLHERKFAHTCVSAGSFLYFYFISWDRISYYWCLPLRIDWLASQHPQIHLSSPLCWYRHYKDMHSYVDVLGIQTCVIHWSTSPTLQMHFLLHWTFSSNMLYIYKLLWFCTVF